MMKENEKTCFGRIDWERVDATTEEEIEAQAAQDDAEAEYLDAFVDEIHTSVEKWEGKVSYEDMEDSVQQMLLWIREKRQRQKEVDGEGE